MANEAQIRVSISIRKTSGDKVLLDYQSRPSAFNLDVTGTNGPTPGAINVTTGGVDVDLSQLTTPGICLLGNLDTTNFFEYGIYDPSNNRFYALGEVGPGQKWPLYLSRNFAEYYAGTGTGTSADTIRLRLKANGAALKATVEAFEK